MINARINVSKGYEVLNRSADIHDKLVGSSDKLVY